MVGGGEGLWGGRKGEGERGETFQIQHKWAFFLRLRIFEGHPGVCIPLFLFVEVLKKKIESENPSL